MKQNKKLSVEEQMDTVKKTLDKLINKYPDVGAIILPVASISTKESRAELKQSLINNGVLDKQILSFETYIIPAWRRFLNRFNRWSFCPKCNKFGLRKTVDDLGNTYCYYCGSDFISATKGDVLLRQVK